MAGFINVGSKVDQLASKWHLMHIRQTFWLGRTLWYDFIHSLRDKRIVIVDKPFCILVPND